VRAILSLCACLLLVAGQQAAGWLDDLLKTATRKEHRAVRLVLVSGESSWQTVSDPGARRVLGDEGVRARVFAQATAGYAYIPPRPGPVFVFVNTSRVAPRLVDLVAAHEVGHVLLHSRGFLQVLAPADPASEALVADSFNVVQDVLLERELVERGIDSQPLLEQQLAELARGLAMAGPRAVVPDTGRLRTSHLASMTARLLLTVSGRDDVKKRVRALLPGDVMQLTDRYIALLKRPVASPDQYRALVHAACQANGVPRWKVVFAPD
jgi:hypothetical protein